MVHKYFVILFLYLICSDYNASSQNIPIGSKLWFTHKEIINKEKSTCPSFIYIPQSSSTFNSISKELIASLKSLYCKDVNKIKQMKPFSLCVGTSSQANLSAFFNQGELKLLKHDGYIIRTVDNNKTIVIANTEIGLLYGTYHDLRCIQTDITYNGEFDIQIASYQQRILNHWDNLDGTVERGYAGHSIWKWEDLPQKISLRYMEYAKAN